MILENPFGASPSLSGSWFRACGYSPKPASPAWATRLAMTRAALFWLARPGSCTWPAVVAGWGT